MRSAPGTSTRLAPRATLAEGIRALGAALATPADGPTWHLEQPLGEPPDALAWLAAAPPTTKLYFEARERDRAFAGLGVALALDAPAPGLLAPLADALHPAERDLDLRWIAWARFDPERSADPAWAPFGRARAVLPLIALRRDPAGTTLWVHLRAEPGATTIERAARTARRLLAGADPAERAGRAGAGAPAADLPASTTPAAYAAGVRALLARIAAGALDKAVLARLRRVGAPADPWALLAGLRQDHPHTYPFALGLSDGRTFLGATPERLYRRTGRTLETEALAGTARRAADAPADAARAAALLAAPKERREHELVLRHLLEGLAPLCRRLEPAPAPEVLRLRALLHLRTALTADLAPLADDGRLLTALHPTPAVCGRPTPAARALLRATEPFDRGLFSGPVGCFGSAEADVAVALRAALVLGPTALLYAGAGVVAGSDPAAEWEETEAKLEALGARLGTGAPGAGDAAGPQ